MDSIAFNGLQKNGRSVHMGIQQCPGLERFRVRDWIRASLLLATFRPQYETQPVLRITEDLDLRLKVLVPNSRSRALHFLKHPQISPPPRFRVSTSDKILKA